MMTLRKLMKTHILCLSHRIQRKKDAKRSSTQKERDKTASCGVPAEQYLKLTVWLMPLLFVLFAPTCFAQGSTSVLGGKVLDAQNRAIQNAVVTVTSDDTGLHWTATTNKDGDWRVDALLTGNYHFEVVAPGFQKLQYPSFALDMADQKYIDVVLEVGSATSSITVQAVEPLIDTSAAVSGTILETKDMAELPTMSNSANEYGLLTPGVVYSGVSSTQGLYLWSNNGLSGFTTNGSGSGTNAMNYVMDGATDVIPSSGEMAFIPPLDAVQEVRMTTNAYDASIDRTAAGTVNMTLKSGGKNFHGVLYEINKNNFLNANYYGYGNEGIPVPVVRHNEYGGTVGGPVWIPKLYNGRNRGTFFFFSYDGIRDISPYATGTMNLPTAQERTGDFSASYTTQTVNGVVTSYPVELFDPDTAASNGGIRTQFPDNNLSGRISPMAKALLALTPLPNKASDGASTDSNDYVIDDSQLDKFYSFSIRLDQAWNNNHHSYLEYRYNNFWQFAGNPFGLNNILEGAYLIRLNHGLTASHAWVISPKLLLNMTGNATIWREPNYSPSIGFDPTQYGFSSQLAGAQVAKGIPALNGVFGSSSNGYNNIGGTLDDWAYNYDWEGKGYLQQIWGNHTFHYGAEYLVQQEATGDHNSGAGNYNFTGIWTVQNPAASSTPVGYGSQVADFLLGMPASGNENNDASGYYSQPYIGFYVQDDWRTTPKLTLNLGLRWDYQMAMTERHNKYWSRFDPNYNLTAITDYIQPNYAALYGGSQSNAGVQLIQAQGPTPGNFIAKGAILYAGVNGTSRSITDPEPNYWQPRLGFAYQIHPDTVLRGGYGRFVQSNYVANHANQTGYSSSTTFTATNDNYVTPAFTLDNPYPNGLVPQTGNSLGVYTNPGSVTSYYTPDIKRQYTDDVSLHLQQEFKDYLVEIGGVFEHTVGLVVGYQVNNVTPTQFEAAFGPKFTATGAPVTTLPGDVQVTNPFKGAPYVTDSYETSNTLEAYWLLFPNPMISSGSLTEYTYDGRSDHYALQAKVNHHLSNGFMLNYAFSWGKQMDTLGYVTNSVFSQKLLRQLSSSDVRFQNVVSTSYILPLGRGKWFFNNSSRALDSVIGGWELSGMYVMYSGTPLSLPTDSSFFEGGDPGLGSRKSLTHWFNTSKFYPFPTESTTVAQIAAYPSWTGVTSLPGASWTPPAGSVQKNGVYNDFHTWSQNYPTQYGDVRNPYFQTFNLGLRKSFVVWRETKLQLRIDAFNTLNHPIFGNVNTTPGDEYFGYVNGSNTLSQTNYPRTIQLEGKFYF